MPTYGTGIRPLVPPTGDFRTARETAAINDAHRGDRLPVHRTFAIDAESGEGWDEAVAEIMKYNAVDQSDAEVWLQRMLVDPGFAGGGRQYEATVLGVKVRLHGIESSA